jgi:dTDP-glucose pyrophosphorylase
MTQRKINKEHQFGTPLRDGARFTRYTVGTNHGRWWVQVKEESSGRSAARYMLWNREGESNFATELEAIAVMLEWIVHHKYNRERVRIKAESRATH